MKARESAHLWLRERGIRFVFGNPGSTELPFLLGLEGAARYILGLHEGVAVAMADGYAQASGEVAFLNLHAAPGLGNALGALYTALKNRSPLVVTVGDQDRRHRFRAPLLSGPLVEMAKPVSKAAWEVSRAEDLPEALERAFHLALTPPRGPVVVAVPMDVWEEEAPPPPLKGPLPPDPPRASRGWPRPSPRRKTPPWSWGPGPTPLRPAGPPSSWPSAWAPPFSPTP
ncbi:Thiamine pyrophosphate enzyme-like TPP binding region [Thermus sp. CCB_US3_UF1]|uniref:thiamine pyrophosphate-binding protein n=1 Tax=Thermus sp. CCB_US3_UF1 TaxID=1111069 RepID=UPI000238A3A5|nr:thiamine pyrophosphate-binding protein [Thermus sp. CCB_US3_UF1]AEV15142.1 Thiamine pyrophosphate enzyme-like TPP binding region [Thermus sp. CCB_US3_UF1]